jgi:hypothetical protein
VTPDDVRKLADSYHSGQTVYTKAGASDKRLAEILRALADVAEAATQWGDNATPHRVLQLFDALARLEALP